MIYEKNTFLLYDKINVNVKVTARSSTDGTFSESMPKAIHQQERVW